MSLLDVSPYLVTAENPATSNAEALDWTRCAALHNYILAIGVQNSGRELTTDDQKSWWEFHDSKAERLSGSLSPSLTHFLKHAQIGPDVNEHSFFYYVIGLTPPDAMWMNHEAEIGEVGGSVLTLYTANDIASHPDGLNFDQEGHDCIIQMSIMDSFITTSGRQSWYPLETVLSIWISMIECSKVQAVPRDNLSSRSGAYQKPWVMFTFSPRQLSETLDAWEQYIEMIRSRLDADSSTTSDIGLVDDSILDSIGIPPGTFVREFLTKAKRPQFKYLAPGLSIPDHITFSTSQSFAFPSEPPSEGISFISELPPILIFPLGTDAVPSTGIAPNNPFHWPHESPPRLPSGLYINPTTNTRNPFHDSVTFLLPFPLGSGGFARTSDNALFGENREERGRPNPSSESFADLYQPGYRFFAEGYPVRLINVLESWAQMVENGDWDVADEGISGDIEWWRKADTESWWKFLVPPDSW